MGSHTQLAVSLRQLCWAHLKRDFQKHRELGGAARNTGLRTVHIMFVTVHHKGTKPTKNSLVAHVPTHEQQKSAKTPQTRGWRSLYGGSARPTRLNGYKKVA